MSKHKQLLHQLSQMLGWKKSNAFYAKKLRISEEYVEKLRGEISGHRQKIKEAVKEVYGPHLTSERVMEDGSRELQFKANKPLTRTEIEKLYGIDGVTTTLSSYWNKATGSGKYLISANVKCLTADYTLETLEKELKRIFPSNITPVKLPKIKKSGKALTICIADDHCGMINHTNIYRGVEFDPITYQERLLQLVAEAEELGTFDEVYVISLGDQMNGWNQQTTRGGHVVSSESNETQFDTFTKGRVAFYNALFTSGIGAKYTVVELNNSNHTGLGMAYMANKFLGLYLTNRFPEVEYLPLNEPISFLPIGHHTIVLTHGKDEKYQKRPLPYSINDRTDAYIMEYVAKHKLTGRYITLYKGDLHAYGIQNARFGRYVNVPSVAGASDYGDLNFGNTKAGALLEVFDLNSNKINSTPIWL